GTLIPPLACSFMSNRGHVLALVDENGALVLYNTNKVGEDAHITDWGAHNNAVFDVEWSWGENRLLTASGDQTVCLWDTNTENKLLTFKGHTSSVRSVKYRPRDSAVFASGSRDGHVRIWDARCNVKDGIVTCVERIKNAHSVPQPGVTIGRKKRAKQGPTTAQDSQQSVTAVVFQNDNLLTTAGAVDGCIKVWDIRKIRQETSCPVYSFPYAGTSKRTHGFSSLVFDSYGSRLFASCTDDLIYCYDFATYNIDPVCVYRGHRNTSFYVKAVLSPDDQFLLSGSSDENAYIWQVAHPEASPVILKGHRSEVSDVAWCRTDCFRIVTTSDDNSMRVWRYDTMAQEKRRLGRQDPQITGTAEHTHRDIGTSAGLPVTPKTPRGLKRSSTLPFGPVTETTPKRGKAGTDRAQSPSIKLWLKRCASQPATSGNQTQTDGPSVAKKSAQICDKQTENSKSKTVIQGCSPQLLENLPSHMSGLAAGLEMDSNSRSPKRLKVEFRKPIVESPKPVEMRKSCKRKLTALDDVSPSAQKRQKINFNGVFNEKENHNKEDTERPNNFSPVKQSSPLKDLDSELNINPLARSPQAVKGMSKPRPAPVTPSRLAVNEWSLRVYQSPTANLPNFVVDGPSTPYLPDLTPRSRGVDWLTQMRIQKLGGHSPQEKTGREKTPVKQEDAGTTLASPSRKNLNTQVSRLEM
ncbi:DTLB-like protein, partial [Mya arenaria]